METQTTHMRRNLKPENPYPEHPQPISAQELMESNLNAAPKAVAVMTLGGIVLEGGDAETAGAGMDDVGGAK